MSASGINVTTLSQSFETNLKNVIFFMGYVLNDKPSTSGLDYIDKLDKGIKGLKENLHDAATIDSGFVAEIDLTTHVLELDERLRTLKNEQQKYDDGIAAIEHAAHVLLGASRSSSPHTPPLTSEQEKALIRKLSSPPVQFYPTRARASARTPSPRPSDLSTRSTSPYPMPPAEKTVTDLNDAINMLKVGIDNHYAKIAKLKKVAQGPRKPMS